MRFSLPDINRYPKGFDALARLHAETKKCFLDSIEINMKQTEWFNAGMCAAFGAILYSLGKNSNTVELIDIPQDIETILSKNGFLSHYGRKKIPDSWGTTIAYKRFDVDDNRAFSDYIENEFIHRPEIPEMSPRLLKKFRESIFEIFSNAVLHSRTKLGIFSCGQFFPNKNRLDFMLVDLGVGMHRNIKEHTGQDLSPDQAIEWATKDNNTTKPKHGGIPGGLGLKLLCKFIDLNGGCINIVSDAGYWQRKNKRRTTEKLEHPFPGTVVRMEINTADTSSYSLAPEPTIENIF